MKRALTYVVLIALAATILMSCKKNEITPLIPLKEGATLVLNEEVSGKADDNIAYIDLSTGSTNILKRSSWDLGFYGGGFFRVIINNTNQSKAVMLNTTDLASVTSADILGIEKDLTGFSYSAKEFNFIDDINGSIDRTVIKGVSSIEFDNYVFIIKRGGGADKQSLIKGRVIRNESGGYLLEYGTIEQTTAFKKLNIPKDPAYNFILVSLEECTIVKGEPKTAEWDLSWGYAMYQTKYGSGMIPYGFSDMISINSLGGVEAYEKIYANADERNKAYTAYTKDDVIASAKLFSNDKWVIGSNWRSTMPPTGVKTDRFYILKDKAENYYKIKFISMGVNDGGVRGKPVIEYKLIQ